MCGIFGQISNVPQRVSHFESQANILAHRGPDGVGFAMFNTCDGSPLEYSDRTGVGEPLASAKEQRATVALGHRRLAIVELSDLGHQPMKTENGALWIVFNGEIYNHVELRSELESRGHKFVSHSDTEVILAAYHEWGVDCLNRFNGMWAFCIFDRENKQVFLARDRFGVKPVYLWQNNETLFFASEIKAFLVTPNFQVQPNEAKFRKFLEAGPTEWTRETVFNGVSRLDAGSYIYSSIDDIAKGCFDQKRWWKPECNNSKEPVTHGKVREYTQEYYDLLNQAVGIRLRADVPVGSALSGGLDSSSVVYLASELLKKNATGNRQHSFSSVYHSPGTENCDESVFIREVANQCGTVMNTIEPSPNDIPESYYRMIWHLESPPNSTLMSSWHTFSLVKKTGVKVTLDGQGADELLGGYLFYLPHALSGFGMKAAFSQYAKLIKVHPLKIVSGAALIAILAHLPALLGKFFLPARHLQRMQDLAHGLNRSLLTDSTTSLANLIHYADATSMAFSVESRMPFLDVRLANFLMNLPERYKINNGWTKYIARKAFAGRLSDRIVWRKDKQGWPIPEQLWSEGPLQNWFHDRLSQERIDKAPFLRKELTELARSKSVASRVRAMNFLTWWEIFGTGDWRNLSDM